jgi:endonuclease I
MSSPTPEFLRAPFACPRSDRRSLFGAAILALAALFVAPAEAQKITEVVADHAGSDVYEYIEIAANPANVVPPGVNDTIVVNLSSYRIVELDGSPDGGGNPGKILHVFQPGTTNGAGLWSTGFLTSTLERPVFTILLVSGFTGAVGEDLDAGDDGILDAAPWTAIADGVAFSDGSASARTYAAPVLGPSFDGVATPPGGASRFPYYTDTESVTDWKRNDFDGDGITGLTGTLAAGEARNTPGGVSRVALDDFYAGVDDSTQSSLRTTLHAALETHLRFPYTASTTDTWDILNLADQDPVSSGSILDIYKNATYTKIAGGTGVYNREHSWPNSYGFNDQESASEYTDCHHLFASDTGYNSNRGNQPFGTCTSGCVENATVVNHGFGGGTGSYPGNSNWDNGVVYEVWNHRRGDLARAQLYMDVRYEGGTHPYTGATEKNLVLTDNASLIQSGQPYMGYLSVLLQWHLEDPVDDDERARNDVIESFQGNRNPFVDHPEWVECVFLGTGCGATATPEAASNSPVCEGGTISLTASDIAGATYAWTGPEGFTSSDQNPSIPNATTAMSGTYTVTATVGAVTSAPGTTEVVVHAVPAVPTIDVPTLACTSSPNNWAEVLDYGTGATYDWQITNGVITSGGGTRRIVFTAGAAGSVGLSVTVTSAAGCASPEATAEIEIRPLCLDAIPTPITVGATNTFTGSGFTAGSMIKLFVSTASGPLDTNTSGWTPTSWTPTALTWDIPTNVPLGQGFATVQVVNTDEGYVTSNLEYQHVYGDAADGLPTILTVGGVGLSAPDPSIPGAHVETVLAAGSTVTVTGTGFNGPLVNVFTATGNIGPLEPLPGGTDTEFQVVIPADAPAGPGSFQVVNSGAGWTVSNAVDAVLRARVTVTSVSVNGSTATVTGDGFCALTVINLFNVQGRNVVNLGGLNPGGSAVIPLTFVDAQHFSFELPTGVQTGAAYVMALNPPFTPFTSSGTDPGGAFTVP